MIGDPDVKADPWVPGIIQSLIDRRHLAPLHPTSAWDQARQILHVVSAEHVFDAWQEIKKTRETDATDPVLPLLVEDFKVKLALWLNS